jgi:hypothetical protein
MYREARRSRKTEFTEISGREPVPPHSAVFFFLYFQTPCIPGYQPSRQQFIYYIPSSEIDEQISFAESLAAAQKHLLSSLDNNSVPLSY